MNPSSFGAASSSRIPPTLRDFSDIQKNLNKFLNKKSYVPNLEISRNVPNRPKTEENNVNIKKEEPATGKDKRKSRFERNVLPAVETFAPTNESRSKISLKGKSKSANVTVSNANFKKEIIDKNSTTKHSACKFEQMISASSSDSPLSIPRLRPILNEDKKALSLLIEIMKPEQDESTLFLLKTPKYLPAVLDNSKNPKIDINSDEKKTGHKCTIRDLPEGQIGKLQIMKSGRLRLVLGDCKFWLHQGVNANYKEELVAVKVEPESKTGEIINLGTVQERINVIPANLTQFANL